LPSVEPGYLHKLLPEEMPVEPESWKDIMKDFDKFILPGITHWQSPNFHAYYPSQSSYPSIIGEMLSAGLGNKVNFNAVVNENSNRFRSVFI
jgi:hypothetical protein